MVVPKSLVSVFLVNPIPSVWTLRIGRFRFRNHEIDILLSERFFLHCCLTSIFFLFQIDRLPPDDSASSPKQSAKQPTMSPPPRSPTGPTGKTRNIPSVFDNNVHFPSLSPHEGMVTPQHMEESLSPQQVSSSSHLGLPFQGFPPSAVRVSAHVCGCGCGCLCYLFCWF